MFSSTKRKSPIIRRLGNKSQSQRASDARIENEREMYRKTLANRFREREFPSSQSIMSEIAESPTYEGRRSEDSSDRAWPAETPNRHGVLVKNKFQVNVCHRRDGGASTYTTYAVNVSERKVKVKSKVECTKEIWDATRKSIIRYVLAKNPCEGKVADHYIFNQKNQPPAKPEREFKTQKALDAALDKYDAAMLKYRDRSIVGIAEWDDEKNPKTEYHHVRDILMTITLPKSDDISAFLLGSDRSFRDFKGGPAYYIDVVCGSGGATAAMLTFLHQFNDRDVKLSALLHVLAYYPRFYGFKFGQTCDEQEAFKDMDLTPLTSLTETDYSKFSKETLRALEGLMKHKLFNNERNKKMCATTTDAMKFLQNDCQQNGFHQIRCLKTLKK
jgi:hypothetical protein